MRRAALALMCVCACGCSKKPAPVDDGADSAGPAMAGGAPFAGLTSPPLAFFDGHCARCHGPNGSFYGEAFASIASDRDLHGIVQEMVEGPGFGELDDESLYALVAFHRSLRDGTPFGVVTELSGDAVAGEMLPGTRVSVIVGTDVIGAEMGEASWRAALPGGASGGSLRVRVERNGRVFEWDPREQAWSDAPPPTHEEY
ncbi:MAG: hypothetical protein H6812_03355 [Phycisphaeraceae bacterium]|nr:hypothetical protein [Phycisphaerales bacterium]MCB9842278.1 hypothetical protein [Phycisphaeraceae bacterium]